MTTKKVFIYIYSNYPKDSKLCRIMLKVYSYIDIEIQIGKCI